MSRNTHPRVSYHTVICLALLLDDQSSEHRSIAPHTCSTTCSCTDLTISDISVEHRSPQSATLSPHPIIRPLAGLAAYVIANLIALTAMTRHLLPYIIFHIIEYLAYPLLLLVLLHTPHLAVPYLLPPCFFYAIDLLWRLHTRIHITSVGNKEPHHLPPTTCTPQAPQHPCSSLSCASLPPLSAHIQPLLHSITKITVHLTLSPTSHLYNQLTSAPGRYTFLQIPDLSAHAWHPFTIALVSVRDIPKSEDGRVREDEDSGRRRAAAAAAADGVSHGGAKQGGGVKKALGEGGSGVGGAGDVVEEGGGGLGRKREVKGAEAGGRGKREGAKCVCWWQRCKAMLRGGSGGRRAGRRRWSWAWQAADEQRDTHVHSPQAPSQSPPLKRVTLTFFIRAQGSGKSWTKRLYGLATSLPPFVNSPQSLPARPQEQPASHLPHSTTFPLHLSPPSGSLTLSLDTYSRLLLIAGGMGITHSLSVLTYLSHRLPPQLDSLTLIWIIREDTLLLDVFAPYLAPFLSLTQPRHKARASATAAEPRPYATASLPLPHQHSQHTDAGHVASTPAPLLNIHVYVTGQPPRRLLKSVHTHTEGSHKHPNSMCVSRPQSTNITVSRIRTDPAASTLSPTPNPDAHVIDMTGRAPGRRRRLDPTAVVLSVADLERMEGELQRQYRQRQAQQQGQQEGLQSHALESSFSMESSRPATSASPSQSGLQAPQPQPHRTRSQQYIHPRADPPEGPTSARNSLSFFSPVPHIPATRPPRSPSAPSPPRSPSQNPSLPPTISIKSRGIRPGISELMSELIPEDEEKDTGVIACAPFSLLADIQRACVHHDVDVHLQEWQL